jgi:hypothetical protein
MIRNYVKALFAFTLLLSMFSAVIPLHNILHRHYFVKVDACNSSCEKHIKNYSKPCCTTSDAIFIGELTPQTSQLTVHQSVKKLETFVNTIAYFQFFHLTKNKAPPMLLS